MRTSEQIAQFGSGTRGRARDKTAVHKAEVRAHAESGGDHRARDRCDALRIQIAD